MSSPEVEVTEMPERQLGKKELFLEGKQIVASQVQKDYNITLPLDSIKFNRPGSLVAEIPSSPSHPSPTVKIRYTFVATDPDYAGYIDDFLKKYQSYWSWPTHEFRNFILSLGEGHIVALVQTLGDDYSGKVDVKISNTGACKSENGQGQVGGGVRGPQMRADTSISQAFIAEMVWKKGELEEDVEVETTTKGGRNLRKTVGKEIKSGSEKVNMHDVPAARKTRAAGPYLDKIEVVGGAGDSARKNNKKKAGNREGLRSGGKVDYREDSDEDDGGISKEIAAMRISGAKGKGKGPKRGTFAAKTKQQPVQTRSRATATAQQEPSAPLPDRKQLIDRANATIERNRKLRDQAMAFFDEQEAMLDKRLERVLRLKAELASQRSTN